MSDKITKVATQQLLIRDFEERSRQSLKCHKWTNSNIVTLKS